MALQVFQQEDLAFFQDCFPPYCPGTDFDLRLFQVEKFPGSTLLVGFPSKCALTSSPGCLAVPRAQLTAATYTPMHLWSGTDQCLQDDVTHGIKGRWVLGCSQAAGEYHNYRHCFYPCLFAPSYTSSQTEKAKSPSTLCQTPLFGIMERRGPRWV